MGLGDIVKGATNLITGGFSGIAEEAFDLVKGRFPEKMSEKEEAELKIDLMKLENDKKVKVLNAWNEQEKNWQDHIKEMEGTAKELLAIPILGHLMVFLRASLRPIISALTIYADLMIWSGSWNLTVTAGANADQAWALLWMVNILVFSVLFGERAMKNILPLIERIIEKSVLGKPDYPKTIDKDWTIK